MELIKILKEEEGKEYPALFKKVGEAPKVNSAVIFPDAEEEDDEDDFLEEGAEEYGVDEEDDYDLFDDEEGEEEGSEGSNQNKSQDDY